MVGIIHECLFGFLARNFGPDSVAAVKRAAGLDPELGFRIDTVYDDGEWRRLYGAAIELAARQGGHDAAAFERAFARYSGEDLLVRFPGFLHGVRSARDLIERQPVIHNSIAASMVEGSRRGIRDKFAIVTKPDETVVHYSSSNLLCGFYKALAEWVAEHMSERVEIHEPHCQRGGAPACEIHVRYLGKLESAARG
jgi:hypothetical protein